MPSKVSDVIKHDHRELEEYYDKMVKASDDDERERYQNAFTWELTRHSIGEEIVVYPAMEEHVPGGKAMAEKDRAEHREVKELLAKFQELPASSPAFMPTLRQLFGNLKKHMEEEESEDLPALDKSLSADDSASLAASFERTKMFVPTRSHPSAPDRPPFETVVGLMTAPIDKVMDAFRKFPKD
ncbi:hemerythrin HHE cation binding domain-containing protein [Hypoxylon sp. FL1150]|nr:hemerythrin HHE cation binding domain-containing protein [Hypoxylon sp. FL1150]